MQALKVGKGLNMDNLNITKKFMVELYDMKNKSVLSVRSNVHMQDFLKEESKKKGLKFGQYLDKLLVAVYMHQEKGFDVLDILGES